MTGFMGFGFHHCWQPHVQPICSLVKNTPAHDFAVAIAIGGIQPSQNAVMQCGGEPGCLMDFWAQRCLQEAAEADAAGLQHPQHTTDTAMADTIMDFLFASQDASTASLVWLTCIMADRPDILAKVTTSLGLVNRVTTVL